MQNNCIIFQMATHQLPKIALRLEFLLSTIYQACKETHPIIHNHALESLIEILQFIQKPELKSRFLKELMRMEHTIHKMNLSVGPALYARLYAQIQVLNHVAGRFGEEIQANPFLQSIQSIQNPSTKDCDDEKPQLIAWLESDADLRQEALITWLNALKTLQNTVTIYIALLKNSASFEKIQLTNGYYQRSLPPKTSCHLILVRLEKSIKRIPQMLIGHHGLNLRLLDAMSLREVNEPYREIDLAICQI